MAAAAQQSRWLELVLEVLDDDLGEHKVVGALVVHGAAPSGTNRPTDRRAGAAARGTRSFLTTGTREPLPPALHTNTANVCVRGETSLRRTEPFGRVGWHYHGGVAVAVRQRQRANERMARPTWPTQPTATPHRTTPIYLAARCLVDSELWAVVLVSLSLNPPSYP